MLPVPGPVWGAAPMRADDDRAPPWRRPRWGTALAQCRRVARLSAAHRPSWLALDAAQRAAALRDVQMRLRREGLAERRWRRRWVVVAAVASETLGWTPRPTQLLAAAALLDNHMAEMATGEGKTLAIGLAAAVAALAGVPVHVVTANDYLAARDAAQLTPLFAALGLRVVALVDAAEQPPAQRRAAYAHDIVYATAKDLAFDFLRDRQARGGRSELEQQADSPVRPSPRPRR